MSSIDSKNPLAAADASIARPISLHIGYPRTGSSFLQEHVFARHPECVQMQFEADAVAADEAGESRRILITNESYAGWVEGDTPEEARILKAKFPSASVMIVVRSQHRIFRSYYYLYVKGGGDLSYADYVARYAGRVLDYNAIYDAYVETFGREHVAVFLHEDLVSDMRGTVRRMLRTLGLDDDFADQVDPVIVKPSSSDSVLFLTRLCNRIMRFAVARREEATWYREKPFSIPGARFLDRWLGWAFPSIDLAPSASLIERVYAEGNDALFRKLDLATPPGYPSRERGSV